MLFALEPMVGKMALPAAGGTPGVWNACLFFFQASLLAGALYARGVACLPGTGLQASIHLLALLVAMSFLPIAIDVPAIAAASGDPTLALLGTLAARVAVPTLVLCATTPLLMTWLARSAPTATDPYALYAAGNAGSLVGLVAYPLLLEPRLGVAAQTTAWTRGYV
ncbi:MAG: spermidine synthase, partial [Candidatus Binatia bacterium]